MSLITDKMFNLLTDVRKAQWEKRGRMSKQKRTGDEVCFVLVSKFDDEQTIVVHASIGIDRSITECRDNEEDALNAVSRGLGIWNDVNEVPNEEET